MKISVLTIMPELFGDFLKSPVPRRAMAKGELEIEIVDIRDYAPGSFRHIDDSPFGGGAGMVLRCQPVVDALRDCRRRADAESGIPSCSGETGVLPDRSLEETVSSFRSAAGRKNARENKGNEVCCWSGAASGRSVGASRTILLSPAGIPYTQQKARKLARADHLILLCGHYEGMDARICSYADEQISIGDYILTGGELAAQVIMDSIARLLPGSLREESVREESFENGLLEYPQYTQPAFFEGAAVPEILRSGDHERIRRWRLQQSLVLTRKQRPDLFEKHVLTAEERELLEEWDERKEIDSSRI